MCPTTSLGSGGNNHFVLEAEDKHAKASEEVNGVAALSETARRRYRSSRSPRGFTPVVAAVVFAAASPLTSSQGDRFRSTKLRHQAAERTVTTFRCPLHCSRSSIKITVSLHCPSASRPQFHFVSRAVDSYIIEFRSENC